MDDTTGKDGRQMPDYAKMYRKLFNSQTDAIEILQKAQLETEQMCIEAPDLDIQLLNSNVQDENE